MTLHVTPEIAFWFLETAVGVVLGVRSIVWNLSVLQYAAATGHDTPDRHLVARNNLRRAAFRFTKFSLLLILGALAIFAPTPARPTPPFRNILADIMFVVVALMIADMVLDDRLPMRLLRLPSRAVVAATVRAHNGNAKKHKEE